jgi:hypothetical protein
MLHKKINAFVTAVVFMALSSTSMMSNAELDVAVSGGGERTEAKRISAIITAIDYEGRDVTLEGPLGNKVTLNAGAEVERLQEFAVGDLVVATYVQSLSGELREPTEEELLIPWVEIDAAAIADETMEPGVGVGQAIKAVCTIEGMNRATRTVTVLDPQGDYHVIGDVDPEKMAGVTLGQTIILTYTRAMALSLEKHSES